jgi:uncharacterized protein YbjQ (UPF0145 family)
MPEREPMNPELASALRAYEIEMRDGTERSQKKTLEALRATQRRLGGAAVVAVNNASKKPSLSEETGEQQLAAS